jgi:hypothetical protein
MMLACKRSQSCQTGTQVPVNMCWMLHYCTRVVQLLPFCHLVDSCWVCQYLLKSSTMKVSWAFLHNVIILKCIWNPKSPNQLTEHHLNRAEIDKLLNIPIQLVCIMQHDNALFFAHVNRHWLLMLGLFSEPINITHSEGHKDFKDESILDLQGSLLFELMRIHTWRNNFWMRFNAYISGFLMKFFVQTSQD